jgi:hypothetical protein
MLRSIPEQNGCRSGPLPASALVTSLGRSFRGSPGCRPPTVRSACDLANTLSLPDVDGFARPHQLTTGWTDDAVIWRTITGELTDHHRFLDPERRPSLVDALRTKINESPLPPQTRGTLCRHVLFRNRAALIRLVDSS